MARGLASLEFSVSPISKGVCVVKNNKEIIAMISGVVSFLEKYGWNLILSKFELVPVGFDDPFSCNINKWISAIAARIIGTRKCRAKNRVRVGCETENPPHSHLTNGFPRYGMAEKMFVITVAPQNDIWPHGNTYPRNAAAMSRIKITIPVNHTCGLVFGELLKIPRNMCK